ncbi:putative mitochondrial transport protein fsf1 [Drechslerella stenobrocha 248]|uniref:Sidoreflexin n=1 Tax=Drechslerella stenobrocha 248 TaxID=1043628 RepID=W7HUE1_9PEZI|nr:putative mitochondrial transport protein fsf1 [Drechslerella stenobrocha 248]
MAPQELPASRYDLSTYWGRVRHSADISDPRFAHPTPRRLQQAIGIVNGYKSGDVAVGRPGGVSMDEVWSAKKIVDSTIHPDTGEPVFLPFRMSCFVLSNLVVTAGMLQPGLGTTGTLLWQIANQSLNVAINSSNANKSSPMPTSDLAASFGLAVSASCGVALGLNAIVPRLKRISPSTRLILSRLIPFAAVASAGVVNVFLMRGGEIRKGIDVYVPGDKSETGEPESLGKSRKAAMLAVGETAFSRVMNATPIMVIPPLVLVKLQKGWLRNRPGWTIPVNLGLIFATSLSALPLALGAFPQRQSIEASSLEDDIRERAAKRGVTVLEFNRGI